MTTDVRTNAPNAPELTRRNRIGLVLAILLALGDVVTVFVTSEPEEGEVGPPMEVLVAGALLGAVTLLAVWWTWRTASRVGARVVSGTRILSAVTSLPAFFVEDVPAAYVVAAAAGILLTVACVAMVLSHPADED